jgi:hypothetical protein
MLEGFNSTGRNVAGNAYAFVEEHTEGRTLYLAQLTLVFDVTRLHAPNCHHLAGAAIPHGILLKK